MRDNLTLEVREAISQYLRARVGFLGKAPRVFDSMPIETNVRKITKVEYEQDGVTTDLSAYIVIRNSDQQETEIAGKCNDNSAELSYNIHCITSWPAGTGGTAFAEKMAGDIMRAIKPGNSVISSGIPFLPDLYIQNAKFTSGRSMDYIDDQRYIFSHILHLKIWAYKNQMPEE